MAEALLLFVPDTLDCQARGDGQRMVDIRGAFGVFAPLAPMLLGCENGGVQ
ncbi:MAG: hypothetical protein H8E44_00560 [Planctomycetes bacterium]|nr:hypothetical protein [Planctomycetota bacterium]